MPRLTSGGPGLGVSPDHAWLGCARPGTFTLFETAERREVASLELPIDGETDVVFLAAQRVLVFIRFEDSTGVLAYQVPSLEPISSLELIGRVRPCAQLADRVFCLNESMEGPRIVSLVGRNLNVDPIGVREPVQVGTAAPEERLLVASRDQLECWDPQLRRAMFRIHLPLNKPRFAGFSSRRRLLWFASSLPSGLLEVFRYSDGRQQTRTELGRRILGVDGHPESPRLVVAAQREGQPVELFQFDLSAEERNKVPLAHDVASFVVIEAQPAVLAVAEMVGPIQFVPLPSATALEDDSRTPKRATLSATPGGAVADRLADWRNRLGHTHERDAASPPPVVLDESGEAPDESGDQSGDATGDATGSPSRAAAASDGEAGPPVERSPIAERPAARPQTLAERFAPPLERLAPKPRATPIRAEEPRPIRPPEPRPASEPATAERPRRAPAVGWRDALSAWGEAALSSPHRAAPPPPLPPHARLALATRNLGLDAGAARGLALLYAQWLLGDGERGVPAATLAQVIGADGPSDGSAEGAGWTEALGRGALAERGLLVRHHGRARLSDVVSAFLDGAAPTAALVHTPGPGIEPLDASSVVSVGSAPAGEVADALARHFGRDVALIELAGDAGARPLAARLLEARLHGALPVVHGTDGVERWAPLVSRELLLIAIDGPCPDELQHLPQLTVA